MKRHAPTGRAIAYLRVSTDAQRDSGLGLEAQRASIEQTAARLRLELAATYTDAGLSGTLSVEARPGLADALNALRRGDVLIVAKRDRIARDVLVSVLIEREVAKKGARIVSAAGEGTDSDDPSAIFTRRILDAVGELERALTAARTRAALRAKRAKGECAGTQPFGFRTNGDGRTLHPHADEQHILNVIHECRAAGYSHRATAAELNRLHLLTRAGTPWQHQYVQGVLTTIARHAPQDTQCLAGERKAE
jgi:DNA invertase Pin-like site-specific DNA recombinase